MSTISLNIAATRSRRLPQWREFRAVLTEWSQRIRSRYELLSLDERQLSDIGLSRAEAAAESDKPFWEA
jgi:uncharacterized protein YjiS (DUF1127 family)